MERGYEKIVKSVPQFNLQEDKTPKEVGISDANHIVYKMFIFFISNLDDGFDIRNPG